MPVLDRDDTALDRVFALQTKTDTHSSEISLSVLYLRPD